MNITAMTTALSGYVSGAYNTTAPYVSSAYTAATSYLPSMATLKGAGTAVITASTSTTGLVTIAAIATIIALATIAYRSITNFDFEIDFQDGDIILGVELDATIPEPQRPATLLPSRAESPATPKASASKTTRSPRKTGNGKRKKTPFRGKPVVFQEPRSEYLKWCQEQGRDIDQRLLRRFNRDPNLDWRKEVSA